MNDVDLNLLEQQKIDKLKEYGLDIDSINNFKAKIKKVSVEEEVSLGKELLNLISSKNYDDDKDLDKVVELIYKGALIEYKDEKGDFPLLRCARKNYLKTFIVLVKAGANVNQKNNYLTTATMASARHGNKEILDILILMKADINAKCKDGDNALISARKHEKLDCFFMLVLANANLPVESYDNRSIFTYTNNQSFDSPLLETRKGKETFKNIEDELDVIEEAQKRMIKINE